MNWKSLLHDLRELGMTQEEIAAALCSTQSCISDLATGKTRDPAFAVGDKLQRLHAKLMRRVRAKAA